VLHPYAEKRGATIVAKCILLGYLLSMLNLNSLASLFVSVVNRLQFPYTRSTVWPDPEEGKLWKEGTRILHYVVGMSVTPSQVV
jgi:hypothetical protein